MTVITPSIYGMSIVNIRNKFYDLINLGYTKDEVIKITLIFPNIYSLSIDSIIEKRKFYEEIGVVDFILFDPKNLMQGVELSYARYRFYLSIGINIDMDNYKLLFIGQDDFRKKYGYSNVGIKNMYNYDDYRELKYNSFK